MGKFLNYGDTLLSKENTISSLGIGAHLFDYLELMGSIKAHSKKGKDKRYKARDIVALASQLSKQNTVNANSPQDVRRKIIYFDTGFLIEEGEPIPSKYLF